MMNTYDRARNRKKSKKEIWKNGKESKYMNNPQYENKTETFYPEKIKIQNTETKIGRVPQEGFQDSPAAN